MSVIPTYACTKERDIRKFTICSILSMVICFVAYTIAGVFGYSTFGSGKVPGDILQGYSDGGTFLTIAIVAIALKNFTTYPLILFCGREALLGLCSVHVQGLVLPRAVISVVWITLTLVVAIAVPDISPVINMMGSLSAAFIFVFPGVCLLQNTLIKDPDLCLNKDKFLIAFSVLMIAIGAFVCGYVLVESIQDIFKAKPTPELITGLKLSLRDSLCV